MKWFKLFLISILFVLTTVSSTFSQSRFDVHLGLAIPLSNFGLYGMNDDMSDPTVGVNIGGKYSYLFSDNGIGVFVGIDFMYNGINKEYKEEVEEWLEFFNTDQPKYHAYYNIPFSTGISYDFSLNENLVLSCNAGVTVNCLLISDLDIGRYKSSCDPAFGLGGIIGVGLIMKDRVSINLDYLGLGSHTVLCESITGLTNYTEEWSTDLNIHMLTLTAGIVF